MFNPSLNDPIISDSRTRELEALARVQQSLVNARHDRDHYGVSAETVRTIESVIESFEALIARHARPI